MDKAVRIIAYLAIAYFIYQLYLIVKKEKYQEQPVVFKRGALDVENEPSDKNKDIKIKNPVRVVYNTIPDKTVGLDVKPNKEGFTPNYSTVLNDFKPKSYVSIFRDDATGDVECKKSLELKFDNFNEVLYEKNPTTNLTNTKLKPLDSIKNVYLLFQNDNLFKSIGDYKVYIASTDKNGKVLTAYFGKFTLVPGENEILLKFPENIPTTKDNKVLIGLRQCGSARINISEILFNFEGSFDNLKQAILNKEDPKKVIEADVAERLAAGYQNPDDKLISENRAKPYTKMNRGNAKMSYIAN